MLIKALRGLYSVHFPLQKEKLREQPGWHKLCEGTKGLRRKVWIRTKILSPNIHYFVAILRFVTIYALFGNLWAKSASLGQKQCFLDKKCSITCYMLQIILSKISQFTITRKNDVFVAK